MRNTFLLLLLLSGASVLIAEHFIVKKTKQVMISYTDQWCDLFGQLLQSFAELDMQKSIIQKNGIHDVVCSVASGKEIALSQYTEKDQQKIVHELRTLHDLVQQVTKACQKYTKTIEECTYKK